MASTIQSLLSAPFGLYLDHEVLSPECKCTPQKPVELRNVMLEHDGAPTGLTFCEWTQPESFLHKKAVKGAELPVRIRGILPITYLNWLSADGCKLILKELRRRDYASRKAARRGPVANSNLTLDHIFNANGKLIDKKRYIKIMIQATKAGPAVHLNSEVAPGYLVLLTTDQKRQYRIKSLDVECYQRSRLFLERYSVLHTLRTIANLPSTKGMLTPVSHRTPEWFVSQYMERLLHNEDAEDADMSTALDLESDSQEAYLRPHKRRKLRHISKAEVLSKIAAHAKWLVENQKKQKQNKIFEPSEWGRFVREAQQYREQSKQEGYHWGTLRGEVTRFEEDIQSSSSDDEGRMDIDKPSSSRRTLKRKAPQQVPRRNRILSPEVGPSIHGQRSTSPASLAPSETFSNHYDSDFTTDGSSSPSDDDDSDTYPSRINIPLTAYAAGIPVLVTLSKPPLIPRQGSSWICPVEDCLYEIDLWKPTREQLMALGQLASPLVSGRWSWGNPLTRSCFATLVDEHYGEHLLACGVKLVEEGGKNTVQWVGPQPSRAAMDKPTPDAQETIIKEEENFSQS
ncbi:hypothetical protein BC835DRAFT_1438365 [Cytidiella melzeri]|nr:hypothetical protein BC835DRAFT_1438365 [Cytidiella melzeri]